MPSAACTKSRTALGSAPISVCGKITPSCMAWLLSSMRCHRTRCVRRTHLYHTAPGDGSPGVMVALGCCIETGIVGTEAVECLTCDGQLASRLEEIARL